MLAICLKICMMAFTLMIIPQLYIPYRPEVVTPAPFFPLNMSGRGEKNDKGKLANIFLVNKENKTRQSHSE